ncbi:hypothetical protein JL101_020875 [Skermanella rosea]|uniref:hypothetical protein n=1 Tax=Skermanella rosea TaxID=1817965 RepID=UPI00193169DA|nr:hypothetical protein [Skermanella rosea]UEM02428.1 hypothetical protein JL101_020875 [Skermanella rosea]
MIEAGLPASTFVATIGELAAALRRTGRALFVIGKMVSLARAAQPAEKESGLGLSAIDPS